VDLISRKQAGMGMGRVSGEGGQVGSRGAGCEREVR